MINISQFVTSTNAEPTHNTNIASVECEWESVEVRMGDVARVLRELQLGKTADDIARSVGLSDARALRDDLVRKKLPPYRLLRNWYTVVVFVERALGARSLCSVALSLTDDPSKYYRLARVVTGRPWTDVIQRGLAACQTDALDAWRPYLRE